MGLSFSLCFGFVPIFFFAWFVYWLDRYEKEPKKALLAVFLWGAVVAAGSAYVINTLMGVGVYLVTGSEMAAEVATASLVAPVVEEIVKGCAVLLVFLIARHEFDSLIDGAVYAAITALGFAATENTLYIYNMGYLENGWTGLLALAFIRVVLVGWQHPFYTAFFGIGLAVARLDRRPPVIVTAPLIGLAVAIFAHAFHNTLPVFFEDWTGLAVGAVFDWTGWLFMLGLLIVILLREQRRLAASLREELDAGLITPAQYRTACSAWTQALVRTSALFDGRFAATARFYQVCGELAHKKHQLRQMGEENGNSAAIARLRAELAELTSRARG